MDLPAGRCMVNVLSDVVVLDSILGEIAEITHIMYSLHNILLSFSHVPTEWVTKVRGCAFLDG